VVPLVIGEDRGVPRRTCAQAPPDRQAVVPVNCRDQERRAGVNAQGAGNPGQICGRRFGRSQKFSSLPFEYREAFGQVGFGTGVSRTRSSASRGSHFSAS